MGAAARQTFSDDERKEPDVSQGTMRVEHDPASSDSRLPLQHTAVAVTVTGPVADVVVKQTFRNDRDHAIEALYLFPLPAEASVHRLRFRIADRQIHGVIKSRADARRDYEAALQQGRTATLLEEDRPALFSLAVGNIAPGASIEVELAYQELVPFDDGRWRLVVPMTAPSRYREPAAAAPDIVPARARDDHRPRDVEVSVRFAGAGAALLRELRSGSHGIDIDEHPEGGTRVRLAGAPDAPLANLDFALDWRASEQGVRPWLFVERTRGEAGTFLLSLTPSLTRPAARGSSGVHEMKAIRCGNCGAPVSDPSAIRELPGLGPVLSCTHCRAMLTPGTDVVTQPSRPKDVLILVDRSASMRGSEALAARAVVRILGGLGASDAAQLVMFDHALASIGDDATRFYSVTPELAGAAEKLVRAHPARGGSELEEALGLSARIPPRDGRTRVVVLLSDVSVGNEGRLLGKLGELLSPNARLFVLGMGESLERRLAARLARAGGGASETCVAGASMEETLDRFVRRVCAAGPVLTDIAIFWESAAIADLEAGAPGTTRVPDLHGGEAVRVLGHFTGTGSSTLVVTALTSDGRPFRQELDVSLPDESHDVTGLGRAWARRRLERLAEESPLETVPRRDDEGLALGLRWSLVSRWTSLVADDAETSVTARRARKGVLLLNGAPFVTLDGSRKTIGRSPAADGHIEEPGVSRLHAEVVFDGTHFVVRDLASTNGTYVNGVAIRERVLEPGAAIVIGSAKESPRLALQLVEGDESDAFFSYVPTRRGVDARSGEGGRRDAVLVSEERRGRTLREDDDGDVVRSMVRSPMVDTEPPFPASAAAERRASRPAAAPRPAARAPGGLASPARPAMASVPLDPPARAMAAPERSATLARSGPSFVALRSPGAAMAPQGIGPGFSPHAPVRSLASEPYPEHELAWLGERIAGALDLVFLVDATSSMAPFIDEVRARLQELVTAVRAAPLCKSLRLGVVAYRDHPPEERTFVTRVTALTSDAATIDAAVASLEARGGGDGPEAVTDGLFEVVRLDWRSDAARAVVWFGDAPPHGVEPSGDGFPGGCPCGHHWFTQASSCREMGITFFCVGCLPALRTFLGAEEVFRTVARTTRGMFLPLREARLLVPLIASAAESALDGQRIDAFVAKLVAEHGPMLAGADDDERVRWLTQRLSADGVRARGIVDSPQPEAESALKFRVLTATDVRASLGRLRGAGATPW